LLELVVFRRHIDEVVASRLLLVLVETDGVLGLVDDRVISLLMILLAAELVGGRLGGGLGIVRLSAAVKKVMSVNGATMTGTEKHTE
jgi:hypothetical protein